MLRFRAGCLPQHAAAADALRYYYYVTLLAYAYAWQDYLMPYFLPLLLRAAA